MKRLSSVVLEQMRFSLVIPQRSYSQNMYFKHLLSLAKSIAIKLGVVSCILIASLGIVGSPTSANPIVSARCLVYSTPFTKISGFKKTKQLCIRNTFFGNRLVFIAQAQVPGTDLINEELTGVARMFQNINRSLVKSWEWNDDAFGRNSVITPERLMSSRSDCLDVFVGCTIRAVRIDDKNKRSSFAEVTVEWVPGRCISPPNCGGWYAQLYKLKVTASAHEEYWE